MTAKPTILLAMPTTNGIYRLVEDNLRYLGFNVYSAAYDPRPRHYVYPNLWLRLRVKWKRLLGDKSAKQTLFQQWMITNLFRQLDGYPDFDYALFIRSDIYPVEFIEKVKEKTRFATVAYQWDGMQRFADIDNRIALFDRFYAFDKADQKNRENLLFTTNFYFSHNLSEKMPETSDCYFTGSHEISRSHSINAFANFAQEQGWKLDFNMLWFGSEHEGRQFYTNQNIRFINEIMDFSENLKRAKQSKVLVDFVIGEHSGLSFRTFEALGYRKKLITTNPSVADYDFYHPNNILIWDEKNFAALKDFINKPYHELPPAIYKKYSFTNWINTLLEIEPYQPITIENK
ncbi:MAG: hypothetical protein Q4A84_02910 [Neisseria sp.]|uniref:hypothetical protein n=1 Tax=Neisseria sp. TaxID=192066 RepID=UPI0026DADF92|nr:hypothetical protein [Neisseria sp.]MDO4640641.1 hypothetical protein [Neisseria sp.]